MPRDFAIAGPCLVSVKGRSDSSIGSAVQLGLSDQQIHVNYVYRHKPLMAEAWGEVPVDNQVFGSMCQLRMSLIHFNRTVLDVCLQESLGGGGQSQPVQLGGPPVAGTGATGAGSLPITGARLGNNLPLYGSSNGAIGGGNHYITVYLSAPVANNSFPYRFFSCYLVENPAEFPVGAEKSVVQCNWMAIPYTTDPYGPAGFGQLGALVFDYGTPP